MGSSLRRRAYGSRTNIPPAANLWRAGKRAGPVQTDPAAAGAVLDDPRTVASLLDGLREAGATQQDHEKPRSLAKPAPREANAQRMAPHARP